MYILFNAGLILHLCGIVLMMGMTIAGFVTHKYLFTCLSKDKNSTAGSLGTAKLFGKLQMSGGFLIVLGGISMMLALNGIVAEQLWFKIKMLLLLILILNVLLFFRPANAKLLLLFTEQESIPADIQKARRLFTRFYMIQFLIFFCIFVLSVFRFN